MDKKIRPLYDAFGPDGYYRDHADNYQNPHLPLIKTLLQRNFFRLDCTGTVLDFSAGGGEVTLALRALGATQLAGCDPYTFRLFEKNTGLPCLQYDFKDVIRKGLPQRYSAVLSSFALHLCPLGELFSLCWQLLQAAPQLVVITPHKRPALEQFPTFELQWEDITEDERGKKVRMKSYGLTMPVEARQKL